MVRRSSVRRDYIENELPQPQVLLACGFVMLKPRLFRSSWKSTVAPSRYSMRPLVDDDLDAVELELLVDLLVELRVEVELVLEPAAAAARHADAQVQLAVRLDLPAACMSAMMPLHLVGGLLGDRSAAAGGVGRRGVFERRGSGFRLRQRST